MPWAHEGCKRHCPFGKDARENTATEPRCDGYVAMVTHRLAPIPYCAYSLQKGLGVELGYSSPNQPAALKVITVSAKRDYI